MIRFRNFSFTYNGGDKPALSDINLTIEHGEFSLIAGASGSGKSTLSRCCNGLVPHFYGGTIRGIAEVQDMDILKCPPKDLAAKVGMVFQDPENQLVTSGVEREIAFGLENMGLCRNLMARRIEEALDTVGIAHLRFRRTVELSGGEKQKVSIAAVLALHPEVLVLDEPTSELDPQSAEEVLRLLERLNDELGLTIVLIEHRLDRVIHLVDRIVVMGEGKILADGQPHEVMSNLEIEGTGIGLPPVIQFMRQVRAEHSATGPFPLTVKDARLELNAILNSVRPVTFPTVEMVDRPVATVEKLWFAYDDRPVLCNINLEINEGEFIAIMGRNASGKTTLIKHLNGLLKPAKGKVTINGTDTRQSTVAGLSQQVGYIFQNPNDHLFADTVEEEIAFSINNQGVEPKLTKQAVEYALTQFHLTPHRHAYPRYLSGGEKQRVALASVLVGQPKLLILDEPTRGMDYTLKKELMDFLSDYCRKGNTVIMVTHDVETVAEYADRVVLLSEGRIVVAGCTREVLSGAMLFSPQINRLAQALSRYGVNDTTLTVAEMLGQIS